MRARQVGIEFQGLAQRGNRIAVIFLLVVGCAQIDVRRRQPRCKFGNAFEFANGRIQVAGALGIQPGFDVLFELGRRLPCQQQYDCAQSFPLLHGHDPIRRDVFQDLLFPARPNDFHRRLFSRS